MIAGIGEDIEAPMPEGETCEILVGDEMISMRTFRGATEIGIIEIVGTDRGVIPVAMETGVDEREVMTMMTMTMTMTETARKPGTLEGFFFLSLSLRDNCVCVCVREREREREKA